MTRPFCLTINTYIRNLLYRTPAGITVLLNSAVVHLYPAILDMCRSALLDSYTYVVREGLAPGDVLVVMSIGRAYMQTIAQSSTEV